jgi:hypothetical protein
MQKGLLSSPPYSETQYRHAQSKLRSTGHKVVYEVLYDYSSVGVIIFFSQAHYGSRYGSSLPMTGLLAEQLGSRAIEVLGECSLVNFIILARQCRAGFSPKFSYSQRVSQNRQMFAHTSTRKEERMCTTQWSLVTRVVPTTSGTILTSGPN